MPSQVHQVFYLPDPIVHDLHYVINKVPRDLYDFEEGASAESSYWNKANDNGEDSLFQVDDEDVNLVRDDIAPTVFDANKS